MSKYITVKTQIKNGRSLVRALGDLGIQCGVSPDLRQNTVALETHWQSYGGENQMVAIAVQRDDLNKAFPSAGSFDGIGYRWCPEVGTYELVCDHYDSSPTASVPSLVAQRYSVVEATRLARQNGYAVTERQQADGTVQLVCTGGYV